MNRGIFLEKTCKMVLSGYAATRLFSSGGVRSAVDDRLVDTHIHFWTTASRRYPVSAKYDTDQIHPASFTPEDLANHTAGLNICRKVLIQMSYYEYDNRYMTDLLIKNPGRYSGVAVVNVDSEDLAEEAADLYQKGVRGFRIGSPRNWHESDGMDQLWRIAGEKGMAICPLINPADLPLLESMCSKYPETRVVIDHMARIGYDGTVQKEQVSDLVRHSRLPNVYVKFSAFYALGRKEPPYCDLTQLVDHLIDEFGPKRLIWGSDAPYQVMDGHRYHHSVEFIRNRMARLDPMAREWVMHKTAEEIFFK